MGRKGFWDGSGAAPGGAHASLTGSAEESFLPVLHKFGLAIACFSGFSVCQDFKECA